MNRKQRRVAQFQKGKPAKPKIVPYKNINNSNSQEILNNLKPAELVAGINKLLKQLEDAGVYVCDYDCKSRRLFKIQMIRGRFYFLAADLPEERN